MLGEQILNNGYSKDEGYTGLQAILERRFDIVISKDEQLTFGEGPYSDSQIQYAGVDTLKLGLLYTLQVKEMRAADAQIKHKGNKGLYKTAWWENEFAKAVADMEMTGVRLDKDKWYAIEDAVRPIYDKELEHLTELLKTDFWDLLLANDWASDEDTFTTNVWSSSQKKAIILNEVYDFEIIKTAKTELKKLLQEHDPNFPEGLKLSGKAWSDSFYPTEFKDKFAIIKLLILNSKDWNAGQYLNEFLLKNYREFCIEQKWLRPAGEVSLNWASPIQRLKVFQFINPKIPSTGKDVLVDFESEHIIIPTYLAWGETEYQLKNFGKSFYDKHVQIDGKHRTRFKQILKTGRLSSVKPNMLNIPRGNNGLYRAAIIPDEGYDLIDADYDGQELIIVAILAQEKSWLEYMRKGYDIHSKNSELIFGKEWFEALEDACCYYEIDPETQEPKYQKCKCGGHQEMRDNSKAVSFGSIYGISYFKLAFNLKISEDRAKFILQKFFEICPAIAAMMVKFGAYAIRNGFIVEPVFGRVRYFDKWKLSVAQEHGSIERAAFNTPIQSSGSAILKIAFVLMRRWLNHENLNEVIQLLLPYHDETIAQSKPAYTEMAKEKVEHYMSLAAKLAGFPINAGAKSGQSWLEAH
jgi:DNA polymerase I-like protein with 3'-5' exonuclease and polymerase domains